MRECIAAITLPRVYARVRPRWRKGLMSIWVYRQQRDYLTALLHGLVRPVLAVFHIVADLAAVDTLPVLTAELSRPVALCNCGEDTTHRTVKDQVSEKIY